jgi:hypothetical protein
MSISLSVLFILLIALSFAGFLFLFIRQIMGSAKNLRVLYSMNTEEQAVIAQERERVNKGVKRTIFTVLIPVGIGILLFSAYSFVQTMAFITNATRTEGEIVVVRHEVSGSPNNRSSAYYPTFRFTAPTGEVVEVESFTGYDSPSEFQPGQQIEVLYDPTYPEHARINAFTQLWFRFGFAFFFALCLLSIPVGWTLIERAIVKQTLAKNAELPSQ